MNHHPAQHHPALQLLCTEAFPGPNSVVIMDNCAVHNKEELTSYAHDHTVEMVFLPPYSPQYNPIESLFNTLKTWIKSNRDIVCQIDPYLALDAAFGSITPDMCKAWVLACNCYHS